MTDLADIIITCVGWGVLLAILLLLLFILIARCLFRRSMQPYVLYTINTLLFCFLVVESVLLTGGFYIKKQVTDFSELATDSLLLTNPAEALKSENIQEKVDKFQNYMPYIQSYLNDNAPAEYKHIDVKSLLNRKDVQEYLRTHDIPEEEENIKMVLQSPQVKAAIEEKQTATRNTLERISKEVDDHILTHLLWVLGAYLLGFVLLAGTRIKE